MSYKLVYQTNDNGIFVGEIEADESPLEPGVFLIPAGCVEIAPPELAEGEYASWSNAMQSWTIETHPLAAADIAEHYPVDEKYEYINSIQQFMDSAANEFGYDNIQTAVTYAEEPAVLKFQLEGKSFRSWRSLVWDYAYMQLNLVQSGSREKPTPNELILELPQFVLLS